MANITHCDKCNAIIKTGFIHHATLRFRFLNPIEENKEKLGDADFCGKCIKQLFNEYFKHLTIKINNYDWGF